MFNMDVIADFSVFMEGFKHSLEDFGSSSRVFQEVEMFLLGSEFHHILFVDFWKRWGIKTRWGFSTTVGSVDEWCRRFLVTRGEGFVRHFVEFATMGVPLVKLAFFTKSKPPFSFPTLYEGLDISCSLWAFVV